MARCQKICKFILIMSIFLRNQTKKFTIEPKSYTAILLYLYLNRYCLLAQKKNGNWKMAQGCRLSPNFPIHSHEHILILIHVNTNTWHKFESIIIHVSPERYRVNYRSIWGFSYDTVRPNYSKNESTFIDKIHRLHREKNINWTKKSSLISWPIELLCCQWYNIFYIILSLFDWSIIYKN